LGIGVWVLGIGPIPQSPIPNPQSPIPNPHTIKLYIKEKLYFNRYYYHKLFFNYIKIYINGNDSKSRKRQRF
jgi:Zn-dependent peptidase ImmA (M78 family)